MGYSTVKSIEKAMSVLELLTDRALENRPLTLSEITKETAIPQVTARNILMQTFPVVGHHPAPDGCRCPDPAKTLPRSE